MKRRDFFKGVFGAAVVAAIPKSVMEQIEATPIPNVETVKAIELPTSNQILYIYDEDTFLGWSTDFNLSAKRDFIPIPKTKRVKIGKKYYWIQDFDAYPEYKTGPLEWNIQASRLHWTVDDPSDLFNKDLNCVISDKGVQFKGKIFCDHYTISASSDGMCEDASFRGIGEVIMEVV